MISKIKEVFVVLKDFITVIPTVVAFKPPKDDSRQSIGRVFQETAARHADKSAIIFEGRELTWQQFNQEVNRFAHYFKQVGVNRGDTVALFMENRIEFLASFVALAKLGAIAGLINTTLRGKALIHCIESVESIKCIVGEELIEHIDEVRQALSLSEGDYLWVKDLGKSESPVWAKDVAQSLSDMPTHNPPETEQITAGEEACYIFTSGTTGLPKAAKIYHRRYLSASIPFAKVGFHAKQSDRMYVCLPLYHITGLGPGVGSCFACGASIFLRRRFSARHFWLEVQKYQTSLFVYVGEMCRYLAMQPECEEEKNNPIKTMLGNGLRPDVWDTFKQRFNVHRITEIYGSSEGNATFLNLLNKDRTIGTTTATVMLAKYDIEADELVKDETGNLIEATRGEPGLLLSLVDKKYLFDGYKNKDASEAKLIHSVKKEDDAWFNTGDLVREIDVGFALGLKHYQFVDRIGDTYRWRSENVSTNEVGELLNGYEQIEIANVYGVEIPNTEGKAGMASITLSEGEELDVERFSNYVDKTLAPYARPVFIRIQDGQETTGTFKLFKGNLKKEGYDINQVHDRVLVLKPRASVYTELDHEFLQQIQAGNSGF